MSQYLTKTESAKFLGISERQMQRKSNSGAIKFERFKDDRGLTMNFYSIEELEKYKIELEKTKIINVDSNKLMHAKAKALDKKLEIKNEVGQAQNCLMTLEEAAHYTRASEGALKKALKDGGLVGHRNLGSNKWKMTRRQLDLWLENLG